VRRDSSGWSRTDSSKQRQQLLECGLDVCDLDDRDIRLWAKRIRSCGIDQDRGRASLLEPIELIRAEYKRQRGWPGDLDRCGVIDRSICISDHCSANAEGQRPDRMTHVASFPQQLFIFRQFDPCQFVSEIMQSEQ
jgi:hypothetical protein